MDGQTGGRPDRRGGPTTRPAFAKVTQVKTAKKSKDVLDFTSGFNQAFEAVERETPPPPRMNGTNCSK